MVNRKLEEAFADAALLLEIKKGHLEFDDIEENWVFWGRTPEIMAGGLRAIVPKIKKYNAYIIASYEGANKEDGVSGEYVFSITNTFSSPKDLALLLAEFVEIKSSKIYLALKKESQIYVFFPSPKKAVLKIRKDFPELKFTLLRKNNEGGFNI